MLDIIGAMEPVSRTNANVEMSQALLVKTVPKMVQRNAETTS
jgi:hypothetical protein